MKITKIISLILSLSMILAICIFPTHASSGTIVESGYENDANSTTDDVAYRSLATYNDYDTYGYLSNSSDVDWWDIGFNQVGMVNFYLLSPSGCNYSMHIYEYTGDYDNLKSIAVVTNGGTGSFDLARIHVNPGYYLIKIYTNSGSSSSNSYLFRAKNYSDRVSYLSTIDYTPSSSTTTPLSNYCKTHINNLGFSTVNDVYNQTASQTLTQLKNSDIHVVFGESYGNGIIRMKQVSGINSYLAGVRHAALNNQSCAISDLNSGDLSETDLIIFAADKTGATSSAYGNLVDQAIAKGCYCAVGWLGENDQLSLLIWLNGFFEFAQSYHISYAMTKIDSEIISRGVSADNKTLLMNRYYNSSNAYYLYLDNNP